MFVNTIRTGLIGKAMLALLLACVVVSGIPMVAVHSHENGTLVHSHDAHEFSRDHGADGSDTIDKSDTIDEESALSPLHAHNLNAPSVSVTVSISLDVYVPKHSHSYIPPPVNWRPDNVLSPLYRPPIA